MPRSPFRSFAAWGCLLLPLAVGLGLDLLTKHAAFATLVTGTFQDVDGREQVYSRTAQTLPGLVHFQAHRNYGAVFGIAQNQRAIFLVVSVLALGLLAYLFARSATQRLYQILLGLLVAGVLGNLYDRTALGYVRDMIHIFPGWDVFPWIFNIADSMLCTGVGGMFVYTLFHGEDRPPRRPVAVAAATSPAGTPPGAP